jgi:methylmalonyl-CoA epimerase
MDVKIGHIGIVVKDVQAMVSRICEVFDIQKPVVSYNPVKNMKFAVVKIGEIGLEILEDCDPQGKFHQFNEQHGNMIHHIGMVTNTIEQDIAELEVKGVRMADRNPKLGLRGKKIAFLESSSLNGLTIELSEP